MKRKFTKLIAALALLVFMMPSMVGWGQEPIQLFHETFGNNTGSARDWNDSYSVKSGVTDVYADVAYTMTNVKQGKNNTGKVLSGLNQSSTGTDAVFEFGPLHVADYSSLSLDYWWKAASIGATYYTKIYYKTSATGDYQEISHSASGATTFVNVSVSLPEAAQTNTLYLKIVWRTSNTQGVIDEVNITGVSSGGGDTPTHAYTLNVTGADEDAEVALYVDGQELGADDEIAEGETVTVSVIPSDGYTYSVAVKDANNVAVEYDADNDSFTMPTSNVTITVTTTALPTHTITFNAGTGTCDTPTMSGYEGSTIVLPAAVPSEACVSRDWSFAGWATASVSETTTAPTLLNGDYTINGNATLYAVYKVTEGNGGTETFNFETIATDNHWENATVYNPVTIGAVTLTGDQGTSSSACPAYYSSDDSWRMYKGSSLTVSSSGSDVTAVTSTPSQTFTINNGTATISFSGTVKFTEITVTYGTSTTTYNSEPSCVPKVATPTFNPAAGKVEAGTEVSISCATPGSTIYYTVNNGDIIEYTANTHIIINEETTIDAYATAAGYDDSDVVTAHYTIIGNAVFTDGVYTESLGTQESFDSMISSNEQGSNEWYLESYYECATIDGVGGDIDWLITPKMNVENGKLAISFDLWHSSSTSNWLAVKWSTTNNVSGNWTDLEFDEGETTSFHEVNLEITTNASAVYVAFVYNNTGSTSGSYSIRDFVARQYYNVTFNANMEGATGTMAPMSCAAGIATALTNNAYSVSGKAFNGWNTAANGSGTVYAEGGNITITENTTLYAQWVDAYTVILMSNGHLESRIEVKPGNSITLPTTVMPAYVPEGYEFMGWYDGSYFSEDTAPTYIASPYTPSGNVTLNAVLAAVDTAEEEKFLNITINNFTEITTDYTKTYTHIYDEATVEAYGVYKNNSGIQMNSGKGTYIKNTTAMPGYITKFVMTWTASGRNSPTLYANENDVASTLSTNLGMQSNTVTVQTVNITNPSTANYKYFYFDGTTVTGACYMSSFKIYYMGSTLVYSNYCTSLTESCTLTINGYGSSTTGGWYLIASPVLSITPTLANGFITDDNTDPDNLTYDLYYFDQTGGDNGKEWKNYRQHTFNLESGQGYLYASKEGTDLIFTGTAYNGNGVVNLTYSESTSIDDNMRGWNLIGNPFGTTANLPSGLSYYTLNESRTELTPGSATTIGAMKAIFVQATATGQSVTFTKQTRNAGSNAILSLNLSSVSNGLIDRTIVRFDEGNALPKFMLNPNNTKVFIPVESKDYAVVRHEAQGEMPVNFKAAENGTYTLTVNPEGVEMNYLHLIDNKTGNDIDLLCTPSYSFNATTNDYESRFRLVFAAGSVFEDENNANFAFCSNGNWIINNAGEATLQVIDINGRILSSERVNGSVSKTINGTPGVYMLRLINGENVMVQKIVVR